MQSQLSREAAQLIAIDRAVEIASRELVVLVILRGAHGGQASVTVRGVSAHALDVHPHARIDGRMLQAGRGEIVLGRRLAGRFVGAAPGGKIRLGREELTVVGLLDADGSGFESEIWGDADELMRSFRRDTFSSVIAKLKPGTFADFQKRISIDPRLAADARAELDYYGDQSRGLATYVRILGLFLACVFACGALAGAMMTLYGQVAARRREIGTLRALGFPRSAVLAGFLVEGLLLSLAGGAIGTLCATAMQAASFSVMNLATVSSVVFRFRMSAGVAAAAIGFAASIGLAGALLPAIRAARSSVVEAIRQ
jgi:ABC-type lipoprotein release transport system permease subunit